MATRVLIVDDSPTARTALRAALEQDSAFQVVGEAVDGRTATRLLARLSPDIVTMDLFLRKENGLDVACAIMQSHPTPIVIVTAADPRSPDLLFRAMQVGVLEVCPKLPAPNHPDYARERRTLTRVLASLAHVPVVRRHGRRRAFSSAALPAPRPRRETVVVDERRLEMPAGARGAGVLLIGASTGGPPVAARILSALPRPLPVPVLLVQHIAEGFLRNFATWLQQDTGHPVCIVEDAMSIEPGAIHVATEGCHLRVDGTGRAYADAGPAHDYHRPSIDVLFESVAQTSLARGSTALLLTGMGRDGAQGLQALRRAGSFTLVQSPASCAVASMPQRALDLDAASEVLDPADIPASIVARWKAEHR